MSTQFRPLEIPPGCVSNPTKQMRSTNWAEVNLMRWVEGQLAPVGGQSQYNYTFASRCKAIHSWYDLSGVPLHRLSLRTEPLRRHRRRARRHHPDRRHDAAAAGDRGRLWRRALFRR